MAARPVPAAEGAEGAWALLRGEEGAAEGCCCCPRRGAEAPFARVRRVSERTAALAVLLGDLRAQGRQAIAREASV